MKIFVLYDKSGIHSGRELGKYLIKNMYGKATVHRGRPKRLLELLKRGNKYDYIINVGWYKEFPTGGATVLNTPTRIATSSNKRAARKKFVEAEVPAPKLWLSSDKIREIDLPVIARTTHHTKGKGLWYCKTLQDVRRAMNQGATHALKFIPNTREFRVHVMAGNPDSADESLRVIKLSEKNPGPGTNVNSIVKNHESGWVFGYPSDPKDPVLPKIREVAKKAISSFGLHWGAVDIMVSRDTGEPYVLEINSTPCLTDDHANTLEKYAEGISYLVGLKQRELKKTQKPKEVVKPATKANTKKVLQSHLKTFFKRNNL